MKRQRQKKEGKKEALEFARTEYEKQHEYVEELKKKGDASFSLIAAEAFVEGMRDSGYKSTGTAIDEFIERYSEAANAKSSDVQVAVTGGDAATLSGNLRNTHKVVSNLVCRGLLDLPRSLAGRTNTP